MTPDTLIQPDGAVTTTTPANGATYTLAELQEAAGGYIQLVPMADGRTAVVNEDGHFQGLPPNPAASALAGVALVGPVLLCRTERIA